jgi:signal recognition particle subunit SRP54
MSGMMGLPGGRRKATKSPKNKRKGTKGGNNRPRVGGGMPGGFPGGMPQLPPGLDPNALGGAQGLPPGFKLPKLDFNKLNNPKRNDGDKS